MTSTNTKKCPHPDTLNDVCELCSTRAAMNRAPWFADVGLFRMALSLPWLLVALVLRWLAFILLAVGCAVMGKTVDDVLAEVRR